MNAMVSQSSLASGDLKKRYPIWAFLLSAILPGLGQIYNGELNKAAWLMLLFLTFSLPMIGVSLLYLPADWGLMAVIILSALSLGVWLFATIQAFGSAYRHSERLVHSWQGLGVYLSVAILMLFVALPILGREVRGRMIDIFRIPSASMEPTLIAGDYILADMRYNCLGCEQSIKRGDIALFIYPNDRTVRYVKRVIGLPGDRVQLSGMSLKVNGQQISRAPTMQDGMAVLQEHVDDNSWIVVWKDPNKAAATRIDVTIPAGKVFVLGDNRSNSNDSRAFDSIALEDVFGRARQVLLSYDVDRKRLWPGRSGIALHPSSTIGFWVQPLERLVQLKQSKTSDVGYTASSSADN